jgi:uncharacterized protein (TIGR03435 family)
MTLSRISGRYRILGMVLVVGWLCSVAFCQTSSPAQQGVDQQPSPTYEVATIKPWDGKGFAFTLRMYILGAFGAEAQSSAQLIGPAWINTTKYVIQGKPPDSLQDAMKKMTVEERNAQNQLMKQALLVDRFKLKYHIETREIQGYQLVVAKGGIKMKEDGDSTKARATVKENGQTTEVKGTAATMANLVMMLRNAPELDGHPVMDTTGLTERYDFSLNWSSLRADDGTATAVNVDAPLLFTAVQDQLGLRFVAVKAPTKVVVIDHIEPPSEN